MNKVKYVLICLLVVVVMVFNVIGTSYSATLNELNQQKNNVQSQINEAEKELEKLEAEMGEVERQVSQLNTQIQKCQGQIDGLKVQIAENEEKLVQAQAEYDKRNEMLAKRIVAQYEAGDTTYLDFLLSSESLTEFISNYYMIGEIAEMDVSLLNQLENTKKEIEQTKQQLEKDKANLDSQISTLQAKKSERQSYVNQLSEEEKALQRKREEYDAELEDLKNQIVQLSQASGNTSYIGGGTMAYPVPGYPINYNQPGNIFGYRIHPIYKDWRLHTGVDIAAPRGANFVAAESGTVIVAGVFGGYGNTVIINHGGGITTLYGHGTTILVSVGQYVTKGTPVLTVGSSGNSTGPHAHFEVRKNGTPVDPLPYIT